MIKKKGELEQDKPFEIREVLFEKLFAFQFAFTVEKDCYSIVDYSDV